MVYPEVPRSLDLSCSLHYYFLIMCLFDVLSCICMYTCISIYIYIHNEYACHVVYYVLMCLFVFV